MPPNCCTLAVTCQPSSSFSRIFVNFIYGVDAIPEWSIERKGEVVYHFLLHIVFGVRLRLCFYVIQISMRAKSTTDNFLTIFFFSPDLDILTTGLYTVDLCCICFLYKSSGLISCPFFLSLLWYWEHLKKMLVWAFKTKKKA